MRNYVVNSRYRQAPPGIVRIKDGGAWIANKFWAGSGVGGECEVTRVPFVVGQTEVPGNPEYFMRMRWTAMPTQGETQYLPQCRWTWLEHHMYKSRELVGSDVSYRGALRVASGDLYVVPIFWINYSTGDYQIIECPGVSVGTHWTRVEGSVRLPQFPVGKVLDTGHYVGFGYDFIYPTAPTIDVSPIQIWSPQAVVDEEHYWLDSQASLQP